MKNLRYLFALIGLWLSPLVMLAQATTGADTTSRAYQIGHSIGSYLPVAIILVLALLVIRRTYRLSQKDR